MNTGWSSLTEVDIIYWNTEPVVFTMKRSDLTTDNCLSVKYVETARPSPDWGRGRPTQQFISHKLLSDLSSENCGVALENNAVMRAETLRAHDQHTGPVWRGDDL